MNMAFDEPKLIIANKGEVEDADEKNARRLLDQLKGEIEMLHPAFRTAASKADPLAKQPHKRPTLPESEIQRAWFTNKIAKKLKAHMDHLVDQRILFSKEEEDVFKFFTRQKLLKKAAVAS